MLMYLPSLLYTMFIHNCLYKHHKHVLMLRENIRCGWNGRDGIVGWLYASNSLVPCHVVLNWMHKCYIISHIYMFSLFIWQSLNALMIMLYICWVSYRYAAPTPDARLYFIHIVLFEKWLIIIIIIILTISALSICCRCGWRCRCWYGRMQGVVSVSVECTYLREKIFNIIHISCITWWFLIMNVCKLFNYFNST